MITSAFGIFRTLHAAAVNASAATAPRLQASMNGATLVKLCREVERRAQMSGGAPGAYLDVAQRNGPTVILVDDVCLSIDNRMNDDEMRLGPAEPVAHLPDSGGRGISPKGWA